MEKSPQYIEAAIDNLHSHFGNTPPGTRGELFMLDCLVLALFRMLTTL